MPISPNSVLRTAADFVDLAYGSVPHGGVKTAALGAGIIIRALAEVMDTNGLTTDDMVKQIKRIPDWDTEPDDAEIDELLNGMPHKPGT